MSRYNLPIPGGAPVEMSDRELATVLCALRMMQEELMSDPPYVHDSPHFSEDCPCLTLDEIDALCERINVES